MNKNLQPDEVPYNFQIDNVAQILKDDANNQLYDFWMELQVFGVPYAANNEVAGCAGRNDVFYGTLKFTTTTDQISSNTYFLPLNFQNNLNDYQVGASDAIGQTERTITFDLPTILFDAKLYLITSNHGANSGGEEYIRRLHKIYFDQNLVMSYTPGEPSCEPYRVYNTQANGIYGPTPRTDAQWQSFSNWCPGAAIPIREINLGFLNTGAHTFKIDVPSAVFANNEGNFPVSLYLQGTRANLSTVNLEENEFIISPNPSNGEFVIDFGGKINNQAEIEVFDVSGRIILKQKMNTTSTSAQTTINISNSPKGMYFIKVITGNAVYTNQIIKN
jgi:hypothetical protein